MRRFGCISSISPGSSSRVVLIMPAFRALLWPHLIIGAARCSVLSSSAVEQWSEFFHCAFDCVPVLHYFSPFHTSHDYLYGVLSCFFYHIFFHLSSNTLPGPICRRSGPLYLLYAVVQVFSKSTQISHLVEVRHGLDFSPTSVILRSVGSIFCFLFSFSELY